MRKNWVISLLTGAWLLFSASGSSALILSADIDYDGSTGPFVPIDANSASANPSIGDIRRYEV